MTFGYFFKKILRHCPSFCFKHIHQVQNVNGHLTVFGARFKVPHVLLLYMLLQSNLACY